MVKRGHNVMRIFFLISDFSTNSVCQVRWAFAEHGAVIDRQTPYAPETPVLDNRLYSLLIRFRTNSRSDAPVNS